MNNQEERTYFKRDLSWLSFNYRVLLEADDATVPLYDRIKFLSIYSSNLEEFYRVRVSEYSQVLAESSCHSPEEVESAQKTLEEITREVTRQQQVFNRIFQRDILHALEQEGLVLYPDYHVLPEHSDYLSTYFEEEIFPYLQPVLILKDEIRSFLRDSRLYLMVSMRRRRSVDKSTARYYGLLKIPYAKIPRFIPLPSIGDKQYLIFAEDLIEANLPQIFPGFEIENSYAIRVSRDADFQLQAPQETLVDEIKKQVRKRKLGAPNRLVYDADMPLEMLRYLCEVYQIDSSRCIPGGKHRTLEDLIKLPNPTGKQLSEEPLSPLRIPAIDRSGSVSKAVKRDDILVAYPYHTFDYLIRFLTESAYDPRVHRIRITQYRVAENSGVVNALITAAKNGKEVVVFVELKARFDEENNIKTAQQMSRAGIRIVYSSPGFKVHAKMALVERGDSPESRIAKSIAYFSTGNFNENTARVYADFGLFTRNPSLLQEAAHLFDALEGELSAPVFNHLLVSPYNMVSELLRRIAREIEAAKAGKKAYIILKMNGLQDKEMIDALYTASEAGVKIDLLVRGICCLVPEQPFSKNIRVIRLVDTFLEHARVWYFYADGAEELYLSSADWMRRNLSRRVECAFPILDIGLRDWLKETLLAQLADTAKGVVLDSDLRNCFRTEDALPLYRSQRAIYESLAAGEKK